MRWLGEGATKRAVTFGDHCLPHDGDRQSLWLEGGTKSVMDKLKFKPKFVARPAVKMNTIHSPPAIFPRCQFDEANCQEGLKYLRSYRKEWDDERGVWRDRPRHDAASNCADAFQTFACSGFPEGEKLSHVKTRERYSDKGSRSTPSAWAV